MAGLFNQLCMLFKKLVKPIRFHTKTKRRLAKHAAYNAGYRSFRA